MKAMKHAGKEPFPLIYVDPKPDSDAAKSGAKYEPIAKVCFDIFKRFFIFLPKRGNRCLVPRFCVTLPGWNFSKKGMTIFIANYVCKIYKNKHFIMDAQTFLVRIRVATLYILPNFNRIHHTGFEIFRTILTCLN